MPDDARKGAEHKHEHHTYPQDQQVHEPAVRKHLNGAVTQFFNKVARKKDRERNKENIDKKNNPARQVPYIRQVHQVIAAVQFSFQILAKAHSFK